MNTSRFDPWVESTWFLTFPTSLKVNPFQSSGFRWVNLHLYIADALVPMQYPRGTAIFTQGKPEGRDIMAEDNSLFIVASRVCGRASTQGMRVSEGGGGDAKKKKRNYPPVIIPYQKG